MYCLFCAVFCIVCVYMCTELLPPGGYPIAVKYIIYHIILVSYQVYVLQVPCLLPSVPASKQPQNLYDTYVMLYA